MHITVPVTVQATVSAGTPVLIGPMVVDFGDIPLDGNVKTLFVPDVGTVLLRLFPDTSAAHLTQWDVGNLYVGQNVAASGTTNYLANAAAGSIGLGAGGDLDTIVDGASGQVSLQGTQYWSAATVFASTDPVQILFSNPGDDPGPAAGHCELYALIATPVAPSS